jgi:protein transport protein SEC24
LTLTFLLGLSVSTHLGAFHQASPSDLTVAVSHADSAILTTFTHSGRLDDRREAHIQCATLYTSRSGERRVRVLNLAVQVSTLAGNVFKNADLETVCCTFTREGEYIKSFTSESDIDICLQHYK